MIDYKVDLNKFPKIEDKDALLKVYLISLSDKYNQALQSLDEISKERKSLPHYDKDGNRWPVTSAEYRALQDVLRRHAIANQKVLYLNGVIQKAYSACIVAMGNALNASSTFVPQNNDPVVYPRGCGTFRDGGSTSLIANSSTLSAKSSTSAAPSCARMASQATNVSKAIQKNPVPYAAPEPPKADSQSSNQDPRRSLAKLFLGAIVGIPLIIGLFIGIDAVIDKIKKIRYENDTSYTLSVDVDIENGGSLGHEWSFEILIDGEKYSGRSASIEFEVPKDQTKSVDVTVNATEHDSISDRGSTTVSDVVIADGTHRLKRFHVTERGGRYAGSKASLLVECKVEK